MKISKYLSFLKKISFDIKAAIIGSSEYPYDARSEKSLAFAINYEFALNNKEKFYPHIDKQGIPIAQYLHSGFQYNPTRIASYALANYNLAIFKEDKNARQKFLNIADWFVNQENNLFTYQYNYEELKAPWISCMAQGQGISVLCRAYLLTKEQKYLDAAIQATIPFSVSVKEGGLLSQIESKWPILEEFPFVENPWHVLNGYLYAIIGLVELREINPSAFSEPLFQSLLNTAQKGELWTLKNWTSYDLQNFKGKIRNIATVNYHRVHIAQYKYLANRFPELEFENWAILWESGYNKLYSRLLALKDKILFRIKNPATRF